MKQTASQDPTVSRLSSLLGTIDESLASHSLAPAQPLILSGADLIEADGLQGIGGAVRTVDFVPSIPLTSSAPHLGPITEEDARVLEILHQATRSLASRAKLEAAKHSFAPIPATGSQAAPFAQPAPFPALDHTAPQALTPFDIAALADDSTSDPFSVINNTPDPVALRPIDLGQVPQSSVSVADYVSTTLDFVHYTNDAVPGRNRVPTGMYVLRSGAKITLLEKKPSRKRLTYVPATEITIMPDRVADLRRGMVLNETNYLEFPVSSDDAQSAPYFVLMLRDPDTGKFDIYKALISDVEAVFGMTHVAARKGLCSFPAGLARFRSIAAINRSNKVIYDAAPLLRVDVAASHPVEPVLRATPPARPVTPQPVAPRMARPSAPSSEPTLVQVLAQTLIQVLTGDHPSTVNSSYCAELIRHLSDLIDIERRASATRTALVDTLAKI